MGGIMTVRNKAARTKRGLNMLTNSAIRDHVDVSKKMMAPPLPHPDRKDDRTVNMLKPVGGIAEKIKDNCCILHI